MKTILIPNDLSPEAENAYRYAIDFAQSQPEKVQLVSLLVFQYGLRTVHQTTDVLSAEQLKEEHNLLARLNLLIDKYQLATGINSKLLSCRGSVSEQIVQVAQQQKADFIFMGTKGAQGISAALQGSNTAAVVEEATCPVLAIPEKSCFSLHQSIVFASDLNDSDLKNIHHTIELARHNNARVVLLHLSEKDDLEEDEQVLAWMRELVKKESNYSRIDIEAVPVNNFTHDLTAVLLKLQAGMLVMVPRKHNYFLNLLGLSHTRAMLHQAVLPVLAMPAKLQKEVANPAADMLEETTLL